MAFSERSDFPRTGQEGFAVGISADGDEGHQTQTWRLAAEPLPASLFHWPPARRKAAFLGWIVC